MTLMEGYLDPEHAKDMYKKLVDQGWSSKAAAKEVQIKTGVSTVTWKPIKERHDNFWGSEVEGFGIS